MGMRAGSPMMSRGVAISPRGMADASQMPSTTTATATTGTTTTTGEGGPGNCPERFYCDSQECHKCCDSSLGRG